jgi:CBS domain-containing protein
MVSEVMTRNVRFVTPQENLQRAAQMMDELNVGALPVCDGDQLVGMVTDRDITVRGTAAGRAPTEARVKEVMSGEVRWCFEDQSLDEVMQQMADTQIRRVPVVSHDDQHKLIGIVALGDIVTKASEGRQANMTEQLVEKISSPSEPDMSQQGNNAAAGANRAAGNNNAGKRMDASSAQGYEGDVGLAGAAGATSNAIDDVGLPESDMGGMSGASGGVSGTTGGARGADIG